MNRTEFIVATAIILFAAFMLGWFASWLIHRLSRVTRAEMGELESMAQQLHEAEETRDRAISELEEREADLDAADHCAAATKGDMAGADAPRAPRIPEDFR